MHLQLRARVAALLITRSEEQRPLLPAQPSWPHRLLVNTLAFRTTPGSLQAANLVKAGYDVTVWNRSPGKCEELAQAGAKVGWLHGG